MKLNSDIDLVLAFTQFPSPTVISGDLDDLDKASRSLFKGEIAAALNQARNKCVASLGENGVPFGGLRGAWMSKPPASKHLTGLETNLKAMPQMYDDAKQKLIVKAPQIIGNVLEFCAKYKIDPYSKAPWLKKVKLPDDPPEMTYSATNEDGTIRGTYTIKGDQEQYFKDWVDSRFMPKFSIIPVKVSEGIPVEKIQEFVNAIHAEAETTVANRVKDSMNALENGIAKAISQVEDNQRNINKGTLGTVIDAIKEIQELLPYTDLDAGVFAQEISDLEKALEDVSKLKTEADLSKNSKGHLPALLAAVKAAQERLLRAKSECSIMIEDGLVVDLEEPEQIPVMEEKSKEEEEPMPDFNLSTEDASMKPLKAPAVYTDEDEFNISI